MESALIVKRFCFNPLSVNTFVLFDETKEAIIIDPGMYRDNEEEVLKKFIEQKELSIKYILCTHPHIDHVLGNARCKRLYDAPLLMHEAGMHIYSQATAYGVAFGLDRDQSVFPEPDRFVVDGEEISFGKQVFQVIYTPGHADGSICLYSSNAGEIFVGDVIFADGGYGRTDLPSGNLTTLKESIEKIFALPDDTVIFPGHAQPTTVEKEKNLSIF